MTGFDSSPADFVAFFSRDPAILICLTQAHSSVGLSTEKNSIKIRNSTDSQMATDPLSSKAAVEQKRLESLKTFHSTLTLGMYIRCPSIHDRNLHPDFIIHTTRNKVKKGKS